MDLLKLELSLGGLRLGGAGIGGGLDVGEGVVVGGVVGGVVKPKKYLRASAEPPVALPVDLETVGAVPDERVMVLDEGREPLAGPLNETRGLPEPSEPAALAMPLPVVEVRRVISFPSFDEENDVVEEEEGESKIRLSENIEIQD